METKPVYLSKTLWTNLLLAAGALFFPGGSEWMGKNPELVALVWSGLNIVLRLVTKGKLELWSK